MERKSREVGSGEEETETAPRLQKLSWAHLLQGLPYVHWYFWGVGTSANIEFYRGSKVFEIVLAE